MADETKSNQNNNMKFAITIIIGLVVLLAAMVFVLQQKNNSTTGTTANTSPSTVQTAPTETSDAGALGKNEVKLTNDNFKAEIEDYKGVALVDFYLSTCPHCQKVAKDVTTVSDEMAGKVKVGKLESSENKTTADKFEINGVPTFIVFKDGKQVDRVEGEQTKQQLLDLLNKNLK